jgi:general secretion pathway protein G
VVALREARHVWPPLAGWVTVMSKQDSIAVSGRTSRDSARQGEQGFTLVEMLVVIAIIGLIMGLVGPRVLSYLTESKVKAAKIQMQSFASALDLFNLDTGRYPSTAEGLTALVQRTPGVTSWNGPYLKSGVVPNDPWSHPYVYRAPGERNAYDILSYGSDGQEGGSGPAGDISLGKLTSASNE